MQELTERSVSGCASGCTHYRVERYVYSYIRLCIDLEFGFQMSKEEKGYT